MSILAERVWKQTCAAIEQRACRPEATYRLQFHAGFTFKDATHIAPYLRDLGITHCYASPYLRATPGSTHGYDIVDHGTLNPEVGSEADYDAWVQTLNENGLGQILDIVPNHMGVATNDNVWWNDVLEDGSASPFGHYFDIAWRSSLRQEMQDRVLLPVLGQPYGEALGGGQLQLSFDGGAFVICYFERRFPIAANTYGRILGHRLDELTASLGAEAPALSEFQSILTAVRNLPGRNETDPQKVAERSREKEIIKRRLAVLTTENPVIRDFIAANVDQFNGNNSAKDPYALLDTLLEEQCFRLAYWRVAPDEINYRRFFDVNELAALSMEREDVFEAAHRLVMRLLATGKINALRVDHPDGLFDPAQYFMRLQESFLLACARAVCETHEEFTGVNWAELQAPLRERVHAEVEAIRARVGWPLFVVAEKILGRSETLPDDWAVNGTTGYDCINMINGLFIDAGNAEMFRRRYQELVSDETAFLELTYQKKLLILHVSLASELHMLTRQLDRLAQKNRTSRDFTFNTLRRALREVIACFPVYRTYIEDSRIGDADRRWIEMATRRAITRNPLLGRRVFAFIRNMLLLEYPTSFSEEERAEQRQFVGKFQQVTGPAAAKGLEDTTLYVYNRLVSLNEVGGEPDRFGVTPGGLHKYNASRLERGKLGLVPLSTHDTKRSEDVRARINVLSELPGEWWEAVARWRELNAPLRKTIDDLSAPDANEEYLLYQTLVGAWPLEPYSDADHASFVKRIQDYMTKALHEAKVHTSWINPNEEYDNAVLEFVAAILDETRNRAFLDELAPFRRRVAHFGLFNSLAQTLLKITVPGIADTYQGTELWDFSLVDPDNRRPVDFEARIGMLAALRTAAAPGQDLPQLARDLVNTKEDGRIKMYVNHQALKCRRDTPGLFGAGSYLPLDVRGAAADHIYAFARVKDDGAAIIAVPRLLTQLAPDLRQPPLGPAIWSDTRVVLDNLPGGPWQNVFTGEQIQVVESNQEASFAAADLFRSFPVAMLVKGDVRTPVVE